MPLHPWRTASGVVAAPVRVHSRKSNDNAEADAKMTTDYIFIAAAYLDVAKADADYVSERLRHDGVSTDACDCVILGRKSSGEVRLYRGLDLGQPTPYTDEPTSRLAAGLALALFPSIGADIPASRVREREALSAVAGVVAGALGREDLYELGALLDVLSAGLIAATTPSAEERVRSALTHADASMSRSVSVDLDAIERAVGLIAARHRPRAAE